MSCCQSPHSSQSVCKSQYLFQVIVSDQVYGTDGKGEEPCLTSKHSTSSQYFNATYHCILLVVAPTFTVDVLARTESSDLVVM
jgi:hypothetical protein